MQSEKAKVSERRVRCPACRAMIVYDGGRILVKGHTLPRNAKDPESEAARTRAGLLYGEGPYAPRLLRKTATQEVWGLRPISSPRRRG
jgi:hypothetical protein